MDSESTPSFLSPVSIAASHPLFLSNSDVPGAVLTPYILVDASNYSIWSSSLYNSLLAKNKQGLVDGSCRMELFDRSLHFQWKRCNALVLSWIASSIQKSLISNSAYHQDVFALWQDLKERFDRVNGTKICYLHNDLYTLSQGSLSVAKYYTKLRNIWEELSTMIPSLPVTEDVKPYSNYLQQQKLYKFLLGLNGSFSNAMSQILLMDPLPTLSQAYAMITEEEQRHSNSRNSTTISTEHVAFLGNKSQNVIQNFKPRIDYNIMCDYCHKLGHRKDQCYRLVGYPSGFKFRKGKQNFTANAIQNSMPVVQDQIAQKEKNTVVQDNSKTVITEEQYKQLMELLSKDKSSASTSQGEVSGYVTGPIQWRGQPD